APHPRLRGLVGHDGVLRAALRGRDPTPRSAATDLAGRHPGRGPPQQRLVPLRLLRAPGPALRSLLRRSGGRRHPAPLALGLVRGPAARRRAERAPGGPPARTGLNALQPIGEPELAAGRPASEASTAARSAAPGWGDPSRAAGT